MKHHLLLVALIACLLILERPLWKWGQHATSGGALAKYASIQTNAFQGNTALKASGSGMGGGE